MQFYLVQYKQVVHKFCKTAPPQLNKNFNVATHSQLVQQFFIFTLKYKYLDFYRY
jgi:hypothetical protein